MVCHVRRITNESVELPYDGWLKDALFVKAEELSTDRKVANKLKKWITSPTHVLNPKCERQIEIPNCTNFFISSNDVMPIYIGAETERRYLVYESPANTMPDDMATRLWAKVEDPEALSAVLFRAMFRLNYTDWNPHAPAMKTPSFYELTNETSLSDIDRFVQSLIDGEVLPRSDIWELSDIEAALPNQLQGKGAQTALMRSLKQIRFREHVAKLGNQIKVDGRPRRLWAVRNGRTWKQSENSDVVAEFLKGRAKHDPLYRQRPSA